jgi:putative transposase
MSAAALSFFPPVSPCIDFSASNPIKLTKEEIIRLAKIPARTFWRNVRQPGVIQVETAKVGRNGRPVRCWLVETLPTPLRAKLEAALTRKTVSIDSRKIPEVAPLFGGAAAGSETASFAAVLSPQALAQAQRRLDVIRPMLDFADPANRAKYFGLRLKDSREVKTLDLLVAYISETQLLDGKLQSKATLWRWLGQYREGGLPALARKPRVDKNTSHFFNRFPGAAQLAAAEYYKPHSTVDRVHRHILRDQHLLHIPDAELPSYETVRRYCDSLPKSTAMLAREGRRRWNETCAPHLARGYTDVAAGSIYTADHMIHDVEVWNDDIFASVEYGAPMRLRFTCIMDLRSRKIVGYCWTADGDSRSIATALRRAVERFGVPDVFYCDNGADFKKLAKGARRMGEGEVEQAQTWLEGLGALQQLGITLQLCLPYHPQSKNIERCFRTIHTGLDSIYLGYLTGNAYNKPDATVLASAEHRKLQKLGRPEESKLMPASAFIAQATTYIEQDYNAQHRHRGKGMNQHTPDEAFERGCPPAARRQADPDTLAMLLFERKTVQVRRTAVTVNKRRYMPVSATDWANLDQANLRDVVVAFDPNDPSRAVAFSEYGQKIAALALERLAAHPLTPTDESRAQIAGMSQIRGRLEKTHSIVVQTMNERVALAGHKSQYTDLAERTTARMIAAEAVAELVSQRAVSHKDAAPSETKQPHSADIGERLAQRRRSRNATTQLGRDNANQQTA